MPAVTQPLSIIVDVEVTIGAVAAAAPTFNRGCIIGPTPVIPSTGANSRTRNYPNTAAMTSDGFAPTDPEFISAGLYFGVTPAPQYLTVGRLDLTALQTIVPHSGSSGAGYSVGDMFTVVQGGGSFGVGIVQSEVAGAVTGVGVVPQNQGTGYAIASSLSTVTTTGTGTGLQVDITAIGETGVQAVTACRTIESAWYLCMLTDAVDADNLAIAAYIQSATPASGYFYSTADAAVFSGAVNNVMLQLQALKYKRTLGIGNTAQGGLFPNNIYAAATAMGIAMGLNTGLANSNFTMKFKTMTGIAAEPLTFSQIQNVENASGNLVVNYQNGSYTFFEQGTMADGSYFDELIGIDQLSSDLQFSIMNVLVGLPSVPLTNAGEGLLIAAAEAACERARVRGFIAPGEWTGNSILNLETGDGMPNGYYVQAQSYTLESQADRQARKAMPIYIAIIEAESTHSLIIGISVQR